jgi:hypothetical protein
VSTSALLLMLMLTCYDIIGSSWPRACNVSSCPNGLCDNLLAHIGDASLYLADPELVMFLFRSTYSCICIIILKT